MIFDAAEQTCSERQLVIVVLLQEDLVGGQGRTPVVVLLEELVHEHIRRVCAQKYAVFILLL